MSTVAEKKDDQDIVIIPKTETFTVIYAALRVPQKKTMHVFGNIGTLMANHPGCTCYDLKGAALLNREEPITAGSTYLVKWTAVQYNKTVRETWLDRCSSVEGSLAQLEKALAAGSGVKGNLPAAEVARIQREAKPAPPCVFWFDLPIPAEQIRVLQQQRAFHQQQQAQHQQQQQPVHLVSRARRVPSDDGIELAAVVPVGEVGNVAGTRSLVA